MHLIMNLFDIKRIYDALSGNYSPKVMIISKIDYYTGSGGEDNGSPSVFVRGYIDSQEVYFIRNLDENVYDIAGKFNIPNVEIGNSIKVLKFKHSDQVMVVYDNEFARWKKMRIIFSSKVCWLTNRITLTFCSCPNRWARAMACRSAKGFHQGSNKSTYEAAVRFSPTSPALSEIKKKDTS